MDACEPVFCDAGELTWCNRPRLYWLSWDLVEGEGVSFGVTSSSVQSVLFHGHQEVKDVIRVGWRKVDESKPFPTFTTSRPRLQAGRKPAGIQQCSLDELEAWYNDWRRFPPYQYRRCHSLVNSSGEFRLPDVEEREVMLGFPLHYTSVCGNKADRKSGRTLDTRLIGQLVECSCGGVSPCSVVFNPGFHAVDLPTRGS